MLRPCGLAVAVFAKVSSKLELWPITRAKWLLGFVPYSHSIAIFFCGVVAWKATFLYPYAPIRLWSKANSASLISYTL